MTINPTKILSSILLICLANLQIQAQEVKQFDFLQTVYDGKSNPRYKVAYQVSTYAAHTFATSEYADMAYETIADEMYLHYKSPVDGSYKKAWLPYDEARIKPTGEFKEIEGIKCQKFDFKFDRVQGVIYCAEDREDIPNFGYFAFTRLDYYFRKVQEAWSPENLPGAVMGYELKIPSAGVVKGELISYRASLDKKIPIFNVAGQMVSVDEYVKEYRDFDNGEFNKSIKVGQVAPTFSGIALDGSSVDLKHYQGKVVFMNFWAIWCGGCVAEIPELNKLSRSFKDKGITFIAFTEDQTATVKGYLDKKPFYFTQLANMPNTKNEYGARPIPRSVLIGKDGKIAAIFDWPLAPQFGEEKLAVEKAKVIAAIDAALAK
jgi:thiol-disulfide isomerase/thioredoxin